MYVPGTRKIISSYDVVFDESFSSTLSYTSQSYAEEMAMGPGVTYTPYATSSREPTGDIFTFAYFEEGDFLSETCDNMESGNKSDDNSTMSPLISK